MTAGRDDFPWTVDQFQRYRALGATVEALFPGREVSILDVGGVSPDREGRASWLPLMRLAPGEGRFVLDVRPAREQGFVRGDGRRLPFRDKSFDVVAALDTLEHIPAAARPEFLGELGRVARNLVFLSAPFRDPEVERVESLIFRQIRERHGVEHEQLKEHAACGLPDVSEIGALLDAGFTAGTGFFFGSLTRWLLLQLLETDYLFRRKSPEVLALLDRRLAAADAAPEFEPPFSRHFWAASNVFPAAELERAVAAVKARLREPAVRFGADEARALTSALAAFHESGRVTAVVVSPGRGRRLGECLDHLLTQKVGFDLEVLVWSLGPDPAKEDALRRRYPGVRQIVSGRGEPALQRLLKIAARAAGDSLLLLSDEVMLPLDTVQALYDALARDPAVGLVSPRTVFKRYLTPARHGQGRSPRRILAGRLPRLLPKKSGLPCRWVFNDCLFFRKEAVFERKLGDGRSARRSLFFWEKAGRGDVTEAPVWLTLPTTVYKKR